MQACIQTCTLADRFDIYLKSKQLGKYGICKYASKILFHSFNQAA